MSFTDNTTTYTSDEVTTTGMPMEAYLTGGAAPEMPEDVSSPVRNTRSGVKRSLRARKGRKGRKATAVSSPPPHGDEENDSEVVVQEKPVPSEDSDSPAVPSDSAASSEAAEVPDSSSSSSSSSALAAADDADSDSVSADSDEDSKALAFIKANSEEIDRLSAAVLGLTAKNMGLLASVFPAVNALNSMKKKGRFNSNHKTAVIRALNRAKNSLPKGTDSKPIDDALDFVKSIPTAQGPSSPGSGKPMHPQFEDTGDLSEYVQASVAFCLEQEDKNAAFDALANFGRGTEINFHVLLENLHLCRPQIVEFFASLRDVDGVDLFHKLASRHTSRNAQPLSLLRKAKDSALCNGGAPFGNYRHLLDMEALLQADKKAYPPKKSTKGKPSTEGGSSENNMDTE